MLITDFRIFERASDMQWLSDFRIKVKNAGVDTASLEVKLNAIKKGLADAVLFRPIDLMKTVIDTDSNVRMLSEPDVQKVCNDWLSSKS